MISYVLSKIVQSFFLILGVLMLVFFMIRLNGDPAALMLSREATPEQIAEFRAEYGLDQPTHVQLVRYIGDVAQGDLGYSLRKRGEPNLKLIRERLPGTFELAISALLLAVVVAVPLGVLGGMYPNSSIDFVARTVGLMGQTIPNFWLGMILIIVFAVELGWFPSFGRDTRMSLVLPSVALGFSVLGQLVRLTRSSVLEVRQENYVRTARAKGMEPQRIAFTHVLPNVAIPLISVIGIQFTYLLGGSVYIESIFAWPGLGNLLNDAIRDNDFPLVQAITIFIAMFAIVLNLLTDIIYSMVDPRIRYGD